MAYVILKDPIDENGSYGVSFSTNEIKLNTVLDEMKLELFLEKMNNKSIEEIEKFFKG